MCPFCEQSEKQRRLQLMRQVVSGEEPVGVGGGDEEQISTRQWDNDDYVASLRRKSDEIHQVR